MRNVVTAIQNRDGQSLQQMYAADKPKQQVPEQAAQIFNELFRQLKAAFPALMTSIKDQSDLNELRRQWVLAFIENGITSIDQVNAGMKIARQQATPFLPSPGQFIAWCKKGALKVAGLPDADELYDTEFPYMETEKAAALKLADWLKRMALAIEAHYSEPEEEADDNRQTKE